MNYSKLKQSKQPSNSYYVSKDQLDKFVAFVCTQAQKASKGIAT